MSRDLNDPVLLVGAGPMAQAYALVLSEFQQPLTVVGRGEESATRFAAAVGVRPKIGGLEKWLNQVPQVPRRAIVAAPVGSLYSTTSALLAAGVEQLLVEKPAALDVDELGRLVSGAQAVAAEVFVAYNRRFNASTEEARRLIAADGGARSFSFDFTEVASRVSATSHPGHVKQAWLIANSTHVIDLAFHLGGDPEQLHPLRSGSLPWHRDGARFSGTGSTASGALFSYLADWEGPGRWGVDVRTENHRLLLSPLEELWVQRHDSFDVEQVPLDDDLDRRFKPGLYRQVAAFLDPFDSRRSTLSDIASHHDFVREVVVPIAKGGLLNNKD